MANDLMSDRALDAGRDESDPRAGFRLLSSIADGKVLKPSDGMSRFK